MCTPSELHELDMERARISGPHFVGFEGRDVRFFARSEEDGTFSLDGVRAGPLRVWAGKKTMFYSYTEPLDLQGGGTINGLVLVLKPRPSEDRFEGIVLFPDGQPVPRAKIEIHRKTSHGSGRSRRSSDGEGRFQYVIREKGSYTFKARDREGRYVVAEAHDVPPGTLDLVLQLTALRPAMSLSVVDEEGRCPEEYTVKVYMEETTSHRADIFSRGPFDRAEKTYTFQSTDLGETGLSEVLIPDDEFWLKVEAIGFETVALGPCEPRSAPARSDVILASLPGVRGRIIADGRPVDAVDVGLYKPVDAGCEYNVDDFLCRSYPDAVATAKTDEEGRFCLWPGESGAFYVRAEKVSFAPTELGPLDLDHTAGREDLELTLTRGGAIDGMVVVPAGESRGGVIVGLSRGDGFPINRRVGRDGHYRIDLLTPGYWQVERRDKDSLGHQTRSFNSSAVGSGSGDFKVDWSCVVEEGKTTTFNLDLSDVVSCTLSGILTIDGSLPMGWNASISSDRPVRPRKGHAELSQDGHFTLVGKDPGVYSLCLHGPMGSKFRLSVLDEVILSPEERPWECRLRSGKLEVHGALSHESENARYYHKWSGDGELSTSLLFRPDANGFALLTVPSGKGSLVRFWRDMETGRRKDETIAEVDVPVGGTATVKLD